MRYGNKSFQHINESEKKYILGLYKKMDLGNIFEVKYKTDIQELISDFGKSLETQKRYLSSLFVNLPVNESVIILNNIKESSVKNLFRENKVVLENYRLNYNNLITEETSDLISELDKFHNFLQESMSLELDRISEQVWDYLKSKGSEFVDAAYDAGGKLYDAGKKALDVATQWLNYATDYIVKTGVGPFFEKLRSALFSVAGTAVQIIVSLTGPATAGIGPAIITGIWCIMGLYDLYQITQGADGAWANFIIDVICALTAGSLGNVLGKFVGVVGKTLTQALEGLILKGMGPYIIPVIYVIQKSISTVARWFTWGGNFAKAKLGIGWLADKVAPAIKYMSEVVETLVKKLGLKPGKGIKTPLGQAGYLAGKTVASLIPSATLRTTGALAARMNPAVWGKLANLSSQEVGLIAGQTLEQGAMKAIEKEMNARFKEQPTEIALQWVDQMYGTAYGDAYLAYLGGRKMFKYQNGKLISRVENTANTMRGQYDYAQSQAGRIQQGVGAIVGDNPTSLQKSKVQGVVGKPESNPWVKTMKAKVGT